MATEPETTSSAVLSAPQSRTLTTWKIVFLLVGAATPFAIVVGTLPLGMAFGGPAITWMFAIAAVIIALFCVGYAQMVRRISRPGAFYNYIARGLGRPAGVGAAMVAAIAYTVAIIAAFAVEAVLARASIHALVGVEPPWQLILVVLVVLIGALAYRRINLSAVVVGCIVVVEVIAILALVISIVADKGLGAFPAAAVNPHVFTIGQWTVAFVFAILCFQGYEAGALYAPEAKRPEKTIPRALFVAVVVFAVLLVIVSWALTSVSGVDGQQDAVQAAGITGFVYATVGTYLGTVGLWLLSLLVLLSQFACTLSIMNFIARYLQSLAAEDLLPRVLARTNRHNSPGPAVLILAGLTLVVVLGLASFGIDPYTQISSVGFGIGALGATVLWGLASVAVIAYFRRLPRSERHWWRTAVAPALATILLAAALVAELLSFSYITGTQADWITVLPLVIPAALIFGVAFAFWLRKNRPATYADLAAGDTAEEAALLRVNRLRRQEQELSARETNVDNNAVTNRDENG